MRLGPLFRGTFEVQAGNRPLQGQSKPPVFTGGYDCFELFYENFQVRLLSSASLPSAVYVITSQGEEHAQEQIQEWSELPGCKVCADERDEPGLQQASRD